jgi:hypothetical protein
MNFWRENMNKYDPLENFLKLFHPRQEVIILPFSAISTIIQSKLPQSAFTHRQWWENEEDASYSQRKAWKNAGWKVNSVNLSEEWVKFTRIKP